MNALRNAKKQKPFSMLDIPDAATHTQSVFCPQSAEVRVLMASRIDFSVVRKHLLANLFGTVGNPTKVMIDLAKNFALVEFESHTHVDIALQRLSQVPLFGHPLRLARSKYAFLNFPKSDQPPAPDLQFLEVDRAAFRFPTGQPLAPEDIAPPTACLVLSNLPDALLVNHKLLYQIISAVHEPRKIA